MLGVLDVQKDVVVKRGHIGVVWQVGGTGNSAWSTWATPPPRAIAVKPSDVILKMGREQMKKIPWLVEVASLKKETALNL